MLFESRKRVINRMTTPISIKTAAPKLLALVALNQGGTFVVGSFMHRPLRFSECAIDLAD